MKGHFRKYTLHFTFSAGTSRGILTDKNSWFIFLENNDVTGVGECSVLPGLSIDDIPDYESKLYQFLNKLIKYPFDKINHFLEEEQEELHFYPSIRFGIETALLDLMGGGDRRLFDNTFTRGELGIPINGLVWMGTRDFMIKQIDEMIEAGFDCIKIKIGALDFNVELEVLEYLRGKYGNRIELRLDANGAFSKDEALEKFHILKQFNIHSIEQPVKPGNWSEMAELIKRSPIPVALDEELIGINSQDHKAELLNKIKPQYIVLKPSLIGGLRVTAQWIDLARKVNAGWWVTSALESNIGLNAIAQYVAKHRLTIPQGLGTGMLFHNNIPSPLELKQNKLIYSPEQNWDLKPLQTTDTT